MTEIPETFNLAAALLDRHLEEGRGDRPALRYQRATLTYRDVTRLTNRAGNALRELGVEVEDRVAILLPDSPEFVATFLGAIKIGAVAVPFSTLLTPADYRYMLEDSRAKVVTVTEPLLSRIEEIRRDLHYLRHIVLARHPNAAAYRATTTEPGGTAASALEPGVGSPRKGALSFVELCAAASPELDPEPTSRDDMAFWQYSSGTTGQPKAVVHLQHDNIVTAHLYGPHVLGITREDRVFSVAKLFFSYGLNNSLTMPFRYGASAILLPERPEPRLVYEVITRERPTLFFSVPTSYAALLAVPEEGFAYDVSSIRRCVSAGEPLPAALYERWRRRFGLEILDGIGSTEAGYIFISNIAGRARPGTSGQVIPGYAAKVVDEEGRQVPAGEVGDLWVKGDSIAACYWNRRERTKQTFRGEWLVTGDRYSVDADGYFRYAGRGDDMLKVGGMWVSPVEVEAALIEHPAVLECAVVGRTDADELMKPAAYVVLKDGPRASPALAGELTEFLRGRIARYKCPRWIEFVPELPKTPTGKIQRFRLRSGR